MFKGEDVGAAATAAPAAASAADDDDDRYGMRSTGGNSGDDTDKDSVEGSNASGVLGTPRKKRRKHRGCNAIPSGVDQNKKKKKEKKEKKKKEKKRKKTERERKYSIKEKRVSRKKEGRKKGSPDPSPKNGSRAYESEYKTTSLIRPAADAEDEKQGRKDRASKATGSNTSTTERPGAKNSSRHGTTATGTAGDVLLSCAKDGALAAGVPALTQKQPVVVPLAGIADVHEGDRGVGKAGVGRDEDVKAIRARAMVPMRPEEYEAQQNTIREVCACGCACVGGDFVRLCEHARSTSERIFVKSMLALIFGTFTYSYSCILIFIYIFINPGFIFFVFFSHFFSPFNHE